MTDDGTPMSSRRGSSGGETVQPQQRRRRSTEMLLSSSSPSWAVVILLLLLSRLAVDAAEPTTTATSSSSSSTITTTSVPLLYCANESADRFACQPQLEYIRTAILPWFAPYQEKLQHRDRRQLAVDCRRFCVEQVTYLTFQMPCDCWTEDRDRQGQGQRQRRQLVHSGGGHTTNEKMILLPLIGPLEGPIQLFFGLVEQLPNEDEGAATGQCRDALAEMNCFVTFVSTYTAAPSQGGGSVASDRYSEIYSETVDDSSGDGE